MKTYYSFCLTEESTMKFHSPLFIKLLDYAKSAPGQLWQMW